MFRYFLAVIFSIIASIANAQVKTRFDNLFDSASKYEYIDWNLSYSYAKMALQNKDADFSYEDVISLNTIFDTYYQKLNMLDSSFSINKQSLRLATENKDTLLIAYSLNNMAGIYDLAGNYHSAIQMYQKALSMLRKLNITKQIANTSYNLSIPFSKLHMADSARYYTDKAFENYKKINDYSGIASCYDFYATEADQKGDYDEAIRLYKLEIENFKKVNETATLIIPYQNMADTYLKQRKYNDCKIYLDMAMDLAILLGSRTDMYDVSGTYSKYYEAIGDYKTANYYMRRYYEGKDTMLTTQLKTELSDQKSEFDRENSKALLTIQKMEAEKNLRSKESLKLIFVLSSVFFVVIIILSVNRYRAKQKSFVKLNEYKNQLIYQKEKIEDAQKEIIDSINYAKRIQSAIMAHEEDISHYFPDSFLMYRPKHIVAGDFYFFEVTDTHIFYAAADCTGHGVPGALVSVVCANALTRCVKEFNMTDPGAILDKTRDLVMETFSKSDKEVKDGMDISLIVVPKTPNQIPLAIRWAGANNPLWYYQQGKLHEIKANKQPIGRSDNPGPFDTHYIQLDKGDQIYLFTDGFADQFGGPLGKKFKYRQLEELLLENAEKPVAEQKRIITEAFEKWKNWPGPDGIVKVMDQVDDVLLIGIRV